LLKGVFLKIYYESDPHMGVQVIYDLNGERQYDGFNSFYIFNAWVSSEFLCYELVEITDANYQQLSQQGVL